MDLDPKYVLLVLALWAAVYGYGLVKRQSKTNDPLRVRDAERLLERLDDADRLAIEEALAKKRKIEAIRVLRAATGAGLAEAKFAVEQMGNA